MQTSSHLIVQRSPGLFGQVLKLLVVFFLSPGDHQISPLFRSLPGSRAALSSKKFFSFSYIASCVLVNPGVVRVPELRDLFSG